MEQINLPMILLAAFLSTASPGPATLAIANASMSSGRKHGLAMAAGITTGSWMWSVFAAMGLGAIMSANAWAFEIVRYCGACYLLYLAYKSACSAFSGAPRAVKNANVPSLKSVYFHGLALHISNPKAILFFGALFSLGVPAGVPFTTLSMVIVSVGMQSFLIFHVYAFVFSSQAMSRRYARLQRWFEGLFAVTFGLAGIKMLTSRVL